MENQEQEQEKGQKQKQRQKKRQRCDLPDEQRCTAVTRTRGERCRWARATLPAGRGVCSESGGSEGSSGEELGLCGHHLADLRRGCSASHRSWRAAGEEQLQGTEKGPGENQGQGQGQGLEELRARLARGGSGLLAVRVHAAHVRRVQARMEEEPINCSLVFAEQTRKGKTALMLFAQLEESRGLLVALQAIVSDTHMMRVLASLPAVVNLATATWSEASAFFTSSISNGTYGSGDDERIGGSRPILRTVVDPVVRARLNPALESRMHDGIANGSGVTEEGKVPFVGRDGCNLIHNDSKEDKEISSHLVCFLSVYGGAVYLCGDLLLPNVALEALLQRHQQIAEDRASQRVCKAVLKIEEIFDVRDWDTHVDGVEQVALDIGASPGSWSAWLLRRMVQKHTDMVQRGMLEGYPTPRVVAVDPGDLTAEVLALEGVKHVRAFVAKDDPVSMAQIASAVEGGGERQRADFLVCDMNRHPSEAAALMEAIASANLLANGARLVLTLKLTGKAEVVRKKQIAEAVAVLGPCFIDVQVHHLFGNTEYETMVTAFFQECSEPCSNDCVSELHSTSTS